MPGIDAYTNPITIIRSVGTVNFTGAAATGVALSEDISYPNEIRSTSELLIEAVSIISVQNLDWDLYFFEKAAKYTASVDTDTFVEGVILPASSSKTWTGATLFYYSKTALAIPVRDLDFSSGSAASPKLHLTLVNRNVTAKIAGASGALIVNVQCRPVYFS